MDIVKYQTAFSFDADFLEKIELELDKIEKYHTKESLFRMIVKINEEGLIKKEEIFRFKNKYTGETVELSEMQSPAGFVFTEKVVKLSLLACKRG